MARHFYSDDQDCTPVPGTIVTASDVEIEALGPNKLINGSSIRSPAAIESPLSQVRTTINSWINNTLNTVDDLTDKFHTKEQHFTTTIANLHHRDEDLVTSAMYVLVAGLSGSILTRRSNVFLKSIVPLTFAALAFKYTTPRTFSNTARFAHEIESAQAPQLVKKQDELIESVESIVAQTEAKTKKIEQATESQLSSWKNSFKTFTGLKIDEDVTK